MQSLCHLSLARFLLLCKFYARKCWHNSCMGIRLAWLLHGGVGTFDGEAVFTCSNTLILLLFVSRNYVHIVYVVYESIEFNVG